MCLQEKKQHILKALLKEFSCVCFFFSFQDCQNACAELAECEFFSYEFKTDMHACILKEGYTAEQVENGCVEYSVWVNESGDAEWNVASGPKSCVDGKRFVIFFFSFSVPSVALHF